MYYKICPDCNKVFKNKDKRQEFCNRDCSEQFRIKSHPNAYFLKNLDTEAKAYLLGWIASDGNIKPAGINISVQERDGDVLRTLSKILPKASITRVNQKGKNPAIMIKLLAGSTFLARDVSRYLSVQPGKKSHIVRMPTFDDEKLGWAFLRGYFEGDGTILSRKSSFNKLKKRGTVWLYPGCGITSSSVKMLEDIQKFVGNIKCSIIGPAKNGTFNLTFHGMNSLDFLGKIYQTARNGEGLYLSRKWETYMEWCMWKPTVGKCWKMDQFSWGRTRRDAIPPTKTRASDSGFDLHLLEKIKDIGSIEMYDTGIRITPAYDWYFDLIPRSSIIKSGYMLANSIGVIDASYLGSILVPLIKIDKNAPPLELPCKLVQIIPRPRIHCEIIEVSDFEDSGRSSGSFGSTDSPKRETP